MNRIPLFLRWLAGGLIGVAVITGLLVVKGDGQIAPLPSQITASASPSATTVTPSLHHLLLTVTDRKGATLSATLINKSKNRMSTDIVSIDPHIVMDLDTLGMTSLGSTTLESSPDLVQDATAVATGFPIEGTLVMQRLSLAGLVDGVGGIDIVSTGDFVVSPVGDQPIYVFKGKQHLDGTQASYYATFLQDGEVESARMTRMNQVLSATLSALPSDELRLNEIITALGALAKSTVPSQQIAQLFLDLDKASAWKTARRVVIPTTTSDLTANTQLGWLRVKRGASLALAQQITGTTVSDFGIESRVVVMVASAQPEDRLAARDALDGEGLAFVDGGVRKTPKVTALAVSPQLTQVQVAEITKALKLPVSVVSELKVVGNLPADALVTLGTDVLVPNP